MPRPLFTPEKDLVPIVQEAGWAPGPVWTGAENLAPTRIRYLDHPACNQSLYRLSHPAHITVYNFWIMMKWCYCQNCLKVLVSFISLHVHHVFITDSRKEENMALGLNIMLKTKSTHLKDKKLGWTHTNTHTGST